MHQQTCDKMLCTRHADKYPCNFAKHNKHNTHINNKMKAHLYVHTTTRMLPFFMYPLIKSQYIEIQHYIINTHKKWPSHTATASCSSSDILCTNVGINLSTTTLDDIHASNTMKYQRAYFLSNSKTGKYNCRAH